MTKQIIPAAFLEYCPQCNGKLNLKNVIGGRPTTCPDCDYIEPGGSAVVVTFVSAVMCEYASNLGIDTIFSGDIPLERHQAFHGEVLLPALIERAHDTRNRSGLVVGTSVDSVGLVNVGSGSAMSGARAVMAMKEINIGQTFFELVNSFEDWVTLSREQNPKLYGSEIKIPQVDDVKDLHVLLVKASMQQESEKSVLNEPK
jgi:hypothetical protein